MKQVTKIILSLFVALFFMVGLLPGQTEAQVPGQNRTVRIGCYALNSFIQQTDDGKYEGYGADYMKALADYAGWNVEIVVASNDDLARMLQSGEIDLLMPVNYAKDRTAKFDYPLFPLGEQLIGIYTLKDKDDIYFDDTAKLQGMRIGSVRNTYPGTSLQQYAVTNHFTYEAVPLDDLAALHQALRSGAVDAVVCSGLGDIPDDYKLIGITEISPFYIVAPAGKSGELSKELDEALKMLRYKQPELTGELFDRYLMNRSADTALNLTRDEAAYLKEHPVITVMSFYDHAPIAYRDEKTGELAGIVRDLLDIISQKTGLQFAYTTNPDGSVLGEQLQNDGQVDLIAGVIQSASYRNNPDLHLSQALFNNNVGIVGLKSKTFDMTKAYTVAVPVVSTGTISHIQKYHPTYKIETYATMEDCYRAVLNGKADGAMQNTNILLSLLRHPEFSDLTLWSSYNSEGRDDYCLASRSTADPRLLSIINKGVSCLDKNDIKAVVLKHTAGETYEMTARDFFYQHALFFSAMVIILLACVVVFIFRSRARQQNLRLLTRHNEELVKANAIATAAMEESKRANEAKTEFLSRMSHDIRTPLNGVIGMTALAAGKNKDSQVANYLHKIKISSHYLLSLVNDILTISKINSGKLELHAEPYPQEEFTEYIDGVIHPMCEAKDITFQLQLPPMDHTIIVDKLKFNQIFFNLLSNAVKFTPPGGHVTLSVEKLHCTDDEMSVAITVADDGIGMSKAFQQKMFLPFEQEHSTGTDTNTGSGLGLAITQHLVALMAGTIAVTSEPGKGSTFTLRFTFPTIAPETKQEASDMDTTSLQGKRILIAEDNDINREILVCLLQAKGIVAVTAKNGREALQTFAGTPPQHFDAILMDVRMPIMDGLAATREIRKLDRRDAATIPIIATTANAFQEDIRECLDAGMNGHVAKPIAPDTLFAVLCHMCQSH